MSWWFVDKNGADSRQEKGMNAGEKQRESLLNGRGDLCF